MFHNVERDFNDKLYIGIYYEQTTNYYTITIESKNYTLPDLADMLKSALNLVDPTHVLFEVYAFADAVILSIEWVDQRVDPLDVITITILDDNELSAGLIITLLSLNQNQ
jgi:2-keto-4-pentenoate hydratase